MNTTYGDYTDEACRTPEAKQATRLRALDLVREHSCNLWSPSKNALRYDWMELAGHRAPMLATLLREEALNGGARFIGVDNDEATVEDCRAHYGSEAPAEWVCGDMRSILTVHKHAHLRGQVGVLVYDSHDAIFDSRLSRHLRPVLDFAKEQREKLGEFLLVLNVTADPRYTKPHHREMYARLLSEEAGYNVPVDHSYKSKATPMVWTALRYGF